VNRGGKLAALLVSCGLSAAIVAALAVWAWRRRGRNSNTSLDEMMDPPDDP